MAEHTDTMIVYGIRRLILINSGMYAFSVFPIDSPLSICGRNNSGKSTAINALQFLFLADMRDMDFGKYDGLQTRKFYFPAPGSYVLAEIHLEHGHYVIGATGAGAASHYAVQHFAYRGRFAAEDFQENGTALGLDELLRGLQRRGIDCIKLHPHELRDMLLGIPGDHAFDVTLVPLRGHRERYISAWISVFKNLLHMRNVNSQDLKQLLLSIFDIHLVAGDIDFASEYQRVTEQVDRLRNELLVLYRLRRPVEVILERHERRQELRGRLRAGYREIQHRLEDWHDEFRELQQRDSSRLADVEPRRRELAEADKLARATLAELSAESGACTQWLAEFDKAENEFQLVNDMRSLDDELAALQRDYDATVKQIGDGERAAPEQVRHELGAAERQLRDIDRILANWSQNLWGFLARDLAPEQLAQVFALLNRQLLELPLDADDGITVADEKALKAAIRTALKGIRDGVYRGNGVIVRLEHLAAVDPDWFQDPKRTETQREILEQRIAELGKTLKAAQQIADLHAKRNRLAQQMDAKRRFRHRFAEHLERRPVRDAKRRQNDELSRRLDACGKHLEDLREQERRLDREADRLGQNIKQREARREALEKRQHNILALPPEEPAGHQMHEWDWPAALEDIMDEYTCDYRDKQSADDVIQDRLDRIEELGGGVYLRDREQDCIDTLREAVQSIPEQETLLEKERRASVVGLGNSLKGLRDNFRRLETEIAKFNRAINRRAISNLTRLEIRLERNDDVLTAIEELVKSGAEQLFADAERGSKAADYLYNWVKSQGRRLNLTHLFELCFVVFSQEGREIVYRNLDRIESHGTTITVKALINMHMMGHLLDDGRGGQIRFPYYLDEAAAIDPRNQETLIEQGLTLGFVPILASVKPQAAATYCVQVDCPGDGQKVVIGERDWIELERKTAGNEDTADEADHGQIAETTA